MSQCICKVLSIKFWYQIASSVLIYFQFVILDFLLLFAFSLFMVASWRGGGRESKSIFTLFCSLSALYFLQPLLVSWHNSLLLFICRDCTQTLLVVCSLTELDKLDKTDDFFWTSLSFEDPFHPHTRVITIDVGVCSCSTMKTDFCNGWCTLRQLDLHEKFSSTFFV